MPSQNNISSRVLMVASLLWAAAGGHALAAGPAAAGGSAPPTEKSTIYSPVGKRDPFKPPTINNFTRDVSAVNPLEKFAVEQLQLRAVLRGIGNAKAMFEDPEGKTHIIQEGDVIGRERATVSRILNSEVIVTERTFNYLGVESLYEKVLSLPPDKDPSQGQAGGGNRENGNRTPQNTGGNPRNDGPPAGGANRNEAPAKAAAEGETIRGNPGNKLVY